MKARAALLRVISLYRSVYAEPYIVAGPPADTVHNERARLLRNGLAITAFASLEGFLRARSIETLKVITGNRRRFEDLPEPLQRLATRGVIDGARFRLSIEEDLGEIRRISRDVGAQLQSTSGSTYELGGYMFGASTSNINADSIRQLLAALSVEGGWGAMATLATRMNVGLDSATSFQSLSVLRHQAAHDHEKDVSSGDIQDIYLKCLSIAAPFDALLSRSCRLHADNLVPNPPAKIGESQIELWFTEPNGSGGFQLRTPTGARMALAATDGDDAKREASDLARPTGGIVLFLDSQSVPIDWIPTDID